jgi:hypothetical protein
MPVGSLCAKRLDDLATARDHADAGSGMSSLSRIDGDDATGKSSACDSPPRQRPANQLLIVNDENAGIQHAVAVRREWTTLDGAHAVRRCTAYEGART